MEPRRAIPDVKFNGKNVSKRLQGYLKTLTYTDVAGGESDSISISLQNIDAKWLNEWYPSKGDEISAGISFKNWEKENQDLYLECGDFILDDIKFSGGPMSASFGALSIPVNEAFKATERTKTWKDVTIRQMAEEISGRYSLELIYDADEIQISSVEQSENTDSAFLYDICKTYGLAMKVYRYKIIIFDKGKYEAKEPVDTISRNDFVDDEWEYLDTLVGTYTGARISYTSGQDNEEISAYVGKIKEDAPGSRVLKVNEQASDLSDAGYKAAAKVNESNESATTISGRIFAKPKIVAGVTVSIEGLGKADGKYFVDKATTEISSGKTTMQVELHKVQERITYIPQVVTDGSAAEEKKTYNVGDIVYFNGGTHYVSSYPDAIGYEVGPGTAKITIANGSGQAHPWHLITENWSETHVYGWVDDGTFE